jgi:hypothetical protein
VGLEAISPKAFFVGKSHVGNCEGKKQKAACWYLSTGISVEDPQYIARYVQHRLNMPFRQHTAQS